MGTSGTVAATRRFPGSETRPHGSAAQSREAAARIEPPHAEDLVAATAWTPDALRRRQGRPRHRRRVEAPARMFQGLPREWHERRPPVAPQDSVVHEPGSAGIPAGEFSNGWKEGVG